MIVANLKTIYFSKQEIEKVIVKILTFRRSISLMQSCLALASIISKIFSHKHRRQKMKQQINFVF